MVGGALLSELNMLTSSAAKTKSSDSSMAAEACSRPHAVLLSLKVTASSESVPERSDMVFVRFELQECGSWLAHKRRWHGALPEIFMARLQRLLYTSTILLIDVGSILRRVNVEEPSRAAGL